MTFILMAIWFGGLSGAAVHDLATKNKNVPYSLYRIGVDYSGQEVSRCEEK